MKTQFEYVSPVGTLYIISSEKGLCGLDFKKANLPLSKKADVVQAKTMKQLKEYFSGKRFDFDLPLDLEGTAFQKKVWTALTKIPFGKAISYKTLAEKIKNPKAVRAVGGANGKNPICIIVPCHRVIAHDGTLGGYSGGIDKKIKLLKVESISLS